MLFFLWILMLSQEGFTDVTFTEGTGPIADFFMMALKCYSKKTRTQLR